MITRGYFSMKISRIFLAHVFQNLKFYIYIPPWPLWLQFWHQIHHKLSNRDRLARMTILKNPIRIIACGKCTIFVLSLATCGCFFVSVQTFVAAMYKGFRQGFNKFYIGFMFGFMSGFMFGFIQGSIQGSYIGFIFGSIQGLYRV